MLPDEASRTNALKSGFYEAAKYWHGMVTGYIKRTGVKPPMDLMKFASERVDSIHRAYEALDKPRNPRRR